jgi:hypothetical protein
MGTKELLYRDDLQEAVGSLADAPSPGPQPEDERGRVREIAAFRDRWGGDEAERRFVAHCQELFDRFNRRYFGGVLLPLEIRIGDGHKTVHEVGYRYYGRYVRSRARHCCGKPWGAIELDYSLATHPRKLELVLLHEMLHHYEHVRRRDPDRVCPDLEEPIDEPPYLGAAVELAFLLVDDADVRRWIAIELGLPCGPEDDDRIRFYLRGHSHRFVIAAYNLARLQKRANRWHYA